MPKTVRKSHPWLRAFWYRAYRENVTGLSAMVAYNLMLAVFPFALLVLFIFGQVLKIGGVEASVLDDLQRLFPNVEQGTLTDALDRIEQNSTTIGIAAFAGSLWIGASFWGAMDTAFCRIYHVECRGWIEQKRFSFTMLLVVLLFIAASIVLPAMEAALVSSTDRLPLGLSDIKAIDTFLLLVAALV
ncbi:MAG TPA: YhjD/YihY/BrkB family envelope integrity protein, partial [Solirubrobacterales bacterium]|nr:YhjD/YihY/BrkB family envelope integrity protein [Solirubrobacterales bacterium]